MIYCHIGCGYNGSYGSKLNLSLYIGAGNVTIHTVVGWEIGNPSPKITILVCSDCSLTNAYPSMLNELVGNSSVSKFGGTSHGNLEADGSLNKPHCGWN